MNQSISIKISKCKVKKRVWSIICNISVNLNENIQKKDSRIYKVNIEISKSKKQVPIHTLLYATVNGNINININILDKALRYHVEKKKRNK